jgi:glycosyltransferase involved in cell wall biosynthesis
MAPGSDTPPISLYIPAYNAEHYIARCLNAVLTQSLRPDEIIVVDDGSTDRTAEIAKTFPVRLIQHGRNLGLAAARNSGISAARSEWVAALDADCVASREWLNALSRNIHQSGIALGGGRLDEQVQKTSADRFRKIHMPQHWGATYLSNPPWVPGSNTIISKSAAIAAGLYDERFRTNHEDVDMSRRLRARGHSTFYDPSAVAWHLKEDDDNSVLNALWRYAQMGHEHPPGLLNVVARLAVNARQSLRFVVADCQGEEWGVLKLDLLFPMTFVWWDFRILRSRRGR